MNATRLRLAALACADAVALVALRPDWVQLASDVRAPHTWVDRVGADGAAATLGSAALWCVAVWLAVGLLAAAASALPGAGGRLARRVAGGLLPAAVLRVVAGAIGLSLLAAPVAAGARPLSGQHGSTTASAATTLASPGWPSARSAPPPIQLTWPSTPAPTIPTPAPPTDPVPGTTPQHDDTVTVRPGDSLWLIAARRLGTDPDPTQIAAAWPRWYQANRAEIGADPNLIQPGQVLHVPAGTPSPEKSAS